jgi:flagellar M-ring protein FliF
VALLAVFMLIRPTLKKLLEAPVPAPGSQLNVVAGNDVAGALPGPGNVPALAGPRTDERLDHARSFAKQNPQAVASIVKGWVGGEPA